jgi:hypothetical protein
MRFVGPWGVCALIASVAACSPRSIEGLVAQGIAGIPQGAESIEFRPVEGANTELSQLMDARRLVIRGSTEWEAFWNDLNRLVIPAPALPVIDFGRQTVIAASMGQRPSGGHAIRIEEVFEDEGRLFAVVVETSPGPDCFTTAIITSPVATVVVDRVGREVEFVEQSEALECG